MTSKLTATHPLYLRIPYSLVKLGKLYAAAGRYSEALQHYKEAIQMNPRHKEFYYYKGIAEYHMNRFSEAFSDFTRAYEEGVRNEPEILNYMGAIKYKVGSFKSALRYFNSVLSFYGGDCSKLLIRKEEYEALARA